MNYENDEEFGDEQDTLLQPTGWIVRKNLSPLVTWFSIIVLALMIWAIVDIGSGLESKIMEFFKGE